jgi:NADH-quinone oxidoreductase subunit H
MDFIIISVVKITLVLLVILTTVANLVYCERKISAFIQDRIGPNRTGPWGLLQAPADVLKLFLKEDIVPADAHKIIHTLAPIISITVALSTFAVVPFGDTITLFGREIKLMIADTNIGILYVLAMTSIGVYGLTLSGWASNNKYSLLGGLRSSAQMISYELSMGLSVVGVIMIAGTLELDRIVEMQAGWAWNAVLTPIGFITFLVASFAETNRLPFDLPEAEPELVGGYHTEYSGMKFGMFFMAEYANMITASAVIVTLFLGGWQIPYGELLGLPAFWLSILQVLAFTVKVAVLLFFIMWVRWTIPRFRYDQLMNIGWKVMLPLGVLNLVITAGWLFLVGR